MEKYRGFHETPNGTTTITLRNREIKGEWVYGNTVDRGRYYSAILTDSFKGIPVYKQVYSPTVRSLVTIDKNGKEMYDGDIVKSNVSDEIPHGVIKYSQEYAKYYVDIDDGYAEMDIDEYEPIVIGNLWEDM